MVGLIVTHRALPGMRGRLTAAWQAHMPAAIEANPGHLAYSYGVGEDPDSVVAVQIYRSETDAAAFLKDDAYRAYLAASRDLLADEPRLTRFTPRWMKHGV